MFMWFYIGNIYNENIRNIEVELIDDQSSPFLLWISIFKPFLEVIWPTGVGWFLSRRQLSYTDGSDLEPVHSDQN